MIRDSIKRLLFLFHLAIYSNSSRFVQIVEHQKSGGTWLSRILSEYYKIPFVSRPSSHFPLSSVVRVHAYHQYALFPKRQIYMIRDGRDVLTSFYFHQIIRLGIKEGKELFENLFDARANMPIFLENYFRFRMGNKSTWHTHLNYWLPRVQYLVRYEEMIEDTYCCVFKLIKGFGEKVNSRHLRKAVDNNSFYRISGRTPGEEDSKSFHRKGIVGDWKNYFDLDACRIFNDYAGATLVKLGYELNDDWVQEKNRV